MREGRTATGVERRSGRPQCVILLGSNIQPEQNLTVAIRELGQAGRVLGASRVWQSAPIGFHAQADFCNAAVRLETPLPADELRGELRRIEERLGRVRDPENKNAPRTIDLDLMLYVAGDVAMVYAADEVAERVFAAVPVSEVAADLWPDHHGTAIRQMAANLVQRDGAGLRLTLRKDIDLG